MKSLVPFLFLAIAGCGSSPPDEPPPPWGAMVSREVVALGSRNWVIVAESSFPVISRRGTRTVMVDGEIPEVVEYIVNLLEQSENVRPRFSVARELPFLVNDVSPGIDQYRERLNTALHGHPVNQMDNRALTLLAQSDADKYAVLVFKTKTALPYSNVFIELDSGFWDREAEAKLRSDMSSAEQHGPVYEKVD